MNRQFQIGDSVIALSSAGPPNQPRTKGSSYEVTRVMYCQTNGTQLVNIDNIPAVGSSGYINCDCGKKHNHQGFAFTYSSKFIINDPKAIEESLAEAVENENWDEAILIRDLNV